jgi:hypothetical protein
LNDYNSASENINRQTQKEHKMELINRLSLADTLDHLNEAFFYERDIPREAKAEAARWIAGRQGLEGAYHGMFAPTEADMQNPILLFSGEEVSSRAGKRHILGEEASRNLLLLRASETEVQNAWRRANASMLLQLQNYEVPIRLQGMYCCGTCSTAYWRNITAGGLDRQEERLKTGMEALRSHRQGDGQWRSFPFYHTLLALLEMDLPSAQEEMRYAAPGLEKKLKGLKGEDKYARRRKEIAERVLGKC